MQALLLLSLLGAQAEAGELREPLLDLLGAYEEPPTADALRALGPTVEAELWELAADPSLPPTRRGRAVTALGHFPSEGTRAALARVLDDAAQPSLLRRKAAWSLGSVPGGVAHLLPRLGDGDAQVRAAVVGALAPHVDDPGVRDALAARRAVEGSTTVRAALDGALAAP